MRNALDLLEKVGTKLYEGSSLERGVPYQNIPSLSSRFHRGGSDIRGKRICEMVDVKGKVVVDLGCSVGTISRIIKDRGAKRVVGIDYDHESIALAKAVNGEHVEFIEADISKEIVDSIGKIDVVIWSSQFMWMVKQKGMPWALDFLFYLSTVCNEMVFETAAENDGSAGVSFKQSDIPSMLIMNTCFQDIKNYGTWSDNWSSRDVFVCKDPKTVWDGGNFSRVERVSRTTVRKTYRSDFQVKDLNSRSKEIMERELYFLGILGEFKWFPKAVSVSEYSFDMPYYGYQAKWIPDGDIHGILSAMESKGVTHRDVCPENVCWNGNHCVLLDFSYAVHPWDVTNYHYDLGGKYKFFDGFNDEFSLKKVQFHLMAKGESNERS